MSTSNREKIIVILAAVAMLYGIYEYIFYYAKLPVQSTASGDQENLLLHLSRISQEVDKSTLTSSENYLIEKTEKKWEDVFIPNPMPKPEPEAAFQEESEKTKLPVYTGYLQMEDRMIAIIDGMDYEVGETLPESGYELCLISPAEITVRNKKNRLFPIPIYTNEAEGPYENARKN
ncbi:MAG: hypothetical protein R2941_00095 [Desulfobacterales bacterium]